MTQVIFAVLTCWHLVDGGLSCNPENELRFSTAEACNQELNHHYPPQYKKS